MSDGETKRRETIVSDEGWSWGAFMFDVPFLIAIKKYKMLWWFLLALIPFVNAAFYIIFKIYMGSHGRALAAQSSHFTNQHEYNGFMKAMDHAGKVLFFIFIAGLCIMLFFMIIGAVSFLTIGQGFGKFFRY